MFNISSAYADAERRSFKTFHLLGEACGVSFTEHDILTGSFSITNSCSSAKEMTLGMVNIGELRATFKKTFGVSRSAWMGGMITVSVGLELEDHTIEYIPAGTYWIAEAKHARSGVEIVAYDAMSKLDVAPSFDMTSGTPYEILELISTLTHVGLGQTPEEIALLPNGTRSFGLYPESDIETCRDLLSYLAAAMGCFATISRMGLLELRPFTSTPVAEYNASKRFDGCKFSDFTTSYSGISFINVPDDNAEMFYPTGLPGITLELGDNPLLQYGLPDVLDAIGAEIATAVGGAQYTPFEATLLCGVEHDLGDVITMTEMTAGISSTCIIHSMTWRFNGGCTIKGYGSNPDVGAARSRYDKAISSIKGSNLNEEKYYVFRNARRLILAPGVEHEILNVLVATAKAGYVEFHAEIHALTSAGNVTFRYYINGEQVVWDPEQLMPDGRIIISLYYPFKTSASLEYEFLVTAELDAGSMVVEPNELLATFKGRGLAATDDPAGRIKVADTFPRIQLADVDVEAFTAEVGDIEVRTAQLSDFRQGMLSTYTHDELSGFKHG